MNFAERPFLRGLISGIPIVVGFIPAGMTFGLLAQQAAVGLAETGLFSIAVFAGASQYMAVNLIQTGSGIGEIVLATLLLNFRHFLMSASLARKLESGSGVPRFVTAFGVTDESFAVASARPRLNGKYYLGVEMVSYCAWVAGTFIGFLIGDTLPAGVQAALGVTLYCLFAALVAPILRKTPRMILTAAAAGILNWFLVISLGMSMGWAFIVTMVAVPALAALFPEYSPGETGP